MPRKEVILQIRDLDIQPSCEVTGDLMSMAEKQFTGEVESIQMSEGAPAYQLQRLSQVGSKIRDAVNKRLKGKRFEIREDWRKKLDAELDSPITDESDSVVLAGASSHVRFVKWDSPEEVQKELINVLVEELKLTGPDDVNGFDDRLGATASNGYRYFNCGCAKYVGIGKYSHRFEALRTVYRN